MQSDTESEEEVVVTKEDKCHSIRGVQVRFPFTPYQCQLVYMNKVIQALQEKSNAILESPTGTGKTLCLLCSTLAWREELIRQNRQVNDQQEIWNESSKSGYIAGIPKIIYASRTHSQLSQAIKELKNTSYRPRVSIIGSREQLCIHSDVMKKENNAEKVHACRAKVQSKTCGYYNNLDIRKLSVGPEAILDIEELVMLGNRNRMCPYYLAREFKSEADLIFMPYNYILDIKTRQMHNIDIQNTIVILDEAHNIERICEDSVSFELTTTDLGHCIQNVGHLLEKKVEEADISEEGETAEDIKDFMNLKEIFLNLEKTLDSVQMIPDKYNVTLNGSYIFDYFKSAEITTSTYQTVLDQSEKAISQLTSGSQSVHRGGTYLQKFVDAIKVVFTTTSSGNGTREKIASDHYKVFIKEEDMSYLRKQPDVWTTTKPDTKKDMVRTLCFWCFNPGHAMRELDQQGVRSIILTSGTLSPISTFSSELQLEFPITLQGSHVISSNQVWVGVVSKGSDDARLNSSYQNRFTASYMNSLGNSLVNFSRIVPHGMLVFFPSYVVMEMCMEYWKSTDMLTRIEQHKPVIKEPKKKTAFNTAIDTYYEKVCDPKLQGAAFFAVCRGKVSEGLDFADANGRAVIITGLPYPPRTEPKVRLKIEYLRDARKKPKSHAIYEEEWYRQQASRAVNQAVGRVIRHKHDYGAIVLCDDRFTSPKSIAELPEWLQPFVKKYDKFGMVQKDLIGFFKEAKEMYGDIISSKDAVSSSSTVTQVGGGKQEHLSLVSIPSHSLRSRKRRATPLEEDEDINVEVTHPFPAASLAYIDSNVITGEKDFLTSLRHSELKPLQPHHVRVCPSTATIPASSSFLELQNTSLTCQPVPSTSERCPDMPVKKKIIITDKMESSVTSNKEVKAKEFLVQLKQSLSNDSFQTFKTLISDYKQTGAIDVFLDGLRQLFRYHSTFHLFHGMARYIRPQHMDRFKESYKIHTGRPHS